MKWQHWEDDFLREYYPNNGRYFCCLALNRSEPSVRGRTFKLGLELDKNGEFFQDFQVRAAMSKVGKKRPDQADVMRRLHKEGKLLTELRRQRHKESIKGIWSRRPHPKGMLGKKHSKETLELLAIKSHETYEKYTEEQKSARILKMMKTKEKNGTSVVPRLKASWKAAWREVGGQRCFFRSRWEANYGRYLEKLRLDGKIQKWEHEPETFWFEKIKRGTVSYLPDFRITNNDGTIEYHEVKGWMDDRSKTKIARMGRYYPNVKLEIIDRPKYKELENKFRYTIEGWEI